MMIVLVVVTMTMYGRIKGLFKVTTDPVTKEESGLGYPYTWFIIQGMTFFYQMVII